MKWFSHIALGIALFIYSCSPPTGDAEINTVEVDQLYSVDISSSLKASFDMHDYAGFQYFDPDLNHYVIGIYDDKDQLGSITRQRLKIDGYYQFVEKTVLTYADSTYFEGSCEFIPSPKLKAKSGDYEVYSSFENKVFHLFYRILVFESEDYFFQFVIWMPYENHCNHIEDINQFMYSFQLL